MIRAVASTRTPDPRYLGRTKVHTRLEAPVQSIRNRRHSAARRTLINITILDSISIRGVYKLGQTLTMRISYASAPILDRTSVQDTVAPATPARTLVSLTAGALAGYNGQNPPVLDATVRLLRTARAFLRLVGFCSVTRILMRYHGCQTTVPQVWASQQPRCNALRAVPCPFGAHLPAVWYASALVCPRLPTM